MPEAFDTVPDALRTAYGSPHRSVIEMLDVLHGNGVGRDGLIVAVLGVLLADPALSPALGLRASDAVRMVDAYLAWRRDG